MKIFSEQKYRLFIEGTPELCADGFVTPEYCSMFNVDISASRQELLDGYQDFVTCCEWLDGCQFDVYATHFSPDSLKVKSKIDACSGRTVSNGSLIAAVMCLDLPHVVLSKTPNIAISISRFCPRFQVTVTPSNC